MGNFVLSQRSKDKLVGVHPDLVSVLYRALELSQYDFTVIEGLRTTARQEELFKAKKSQTMNSRHITGHAVDLAALDAGKIKWDWPYYEALAKAMKQAAKELAIPIVWGGDWKTFKDGVHFELSREIYN